MRSKTFMSKINLQRGKLTVENRKSREKKTDMLRSIGKIDNKYCLIITELRQHCNNTITIPHYWL